MEKHELEVGKRYFVSKNFPFSSIRDVPRVVEVVSLVSCNPEHAHCVTVLNKNKSHDILGPGWLVCEATPLLLELE
jgi:hypothetical protein